MVKSQLNLHFVVTVMLLIVANLSACQLPNSSATVAPLPKQSRVKTVATLITPTSSPIPTIPNPTSTQINTPPSTSTPTQTPVLNNPPVLTATPIPINLPSPMNDLPVLTTVTLSTVLLPTSCLPVINITKSIPVHLGPGFEYESRNDLSPSSSGLELRGRNPQNTWFQIAYSDAPDGFAWIPANPEYSDYEFCNVASLHVVQGPATATPTPSSTPLPAPTATPTPFYFFDAFIVEESNDSCVLLNWDVRYVREIYMGGIEDTDTLFIPKPDNTDWMMLTGDYNELIDCPDDIESKKYTLLVINMNGSECSISRIHYDDDFEEQNLCNLNQ